MPPFEAGIPLDVRVATAADFERFRDVLLRERVGEGAIAERRAGGDQCFIGVAEERLVHFTWLVRRPVWVPDLGATLDLGTDESYVPFSYTDPAVRGHRVQPAVVNFMLGWEQSAKVRHHFYFVMGHNVSAMKITAGRHAASAARPLRAVRTVRLLGLRGFLAVGLLSEGRPHLKPGPHVDLGRLGLWIKP